MTTDERLAEIRARADEYFGVIFNRAPIPTDWPARLADSAADMSYLLAEVERLRADRDQAREECGHEKRMRRLVSDQRDRFIAAKMRAEAERDRLAATLNRVRVALAGHPRCEKHAGDDPITCGWKQAVLDVQAAIEGTDS